MVAPVWQTRPECGDHFEGSDCIGRPCPHCDGTADLEFQMMMASHAAAQAGQGESRMTLEATRPRKV